MIDEADRTLLLQIARRSIRSGLDQNRAYRVDPQMCPASLREPAATFVTLENERGLRGCIGRLVAERALVEDVAENAYAAAFRDPRFPPLSEAEYADLHIHISVLGKPEPMEVTDENDLLNQLEPDRDGLILEADGHRATFLPSVWKTLPQPADFLRQLKLKAGLPADFWSEKMEIQRYQCEEFTESADPA